MCLLLRLRTTLPVDDHMSRVVNDQSWFCHHLRQVGLRNPKKYKVNFLHETMTHICHMSAHIHLEIFNILNGIALIMNGHMSGK